MDAGELTTGVGEAVLQPAQVLVEQPADRRGIAQLRDRTGDPGDRHPHPAQARHQAGRPQLVVAVTAVAGQGIHLGGHQDAGAVVEAQRADAEPAGPRDLPDAVPAGAASGAVHVVALHTGNPAASTCSRVKAPGWA
jgi:hypothetical protein